MEYNVQVDKFNEDELEAATIKLFQDLGYEYINGVSFNRKYEDILIEDDVVSFLKSKYSLEDLSELELQKIVNRVSLIQATPLYLGNREAFQLVNKGFDLIRDEKSKDALHIEYIDFDKPDNNIFKVVNQYSVQGERLRRPDLLIFINGIPVVIWEFKTAIEENKTIYDAWEQISIRYRRDIPNLMRYNFLSVISDGVNTRLGSIFTPYEYYYGWNKIKEDETTSQGISSLITMASGAFSKERLLAILRDFIFYPDDSRKEEAIVCRYPQFFAANKMFENIKNHMRPKGDGKGGTYFGATGSGKTYTMLFLSRLIALRDNKKMKNPTVVILTDREDLDTQTSELFVAAKQFLNENDVRSIENREDLAETLLNKPSGGIYLTTIQKFYEGTGLLSDRSNIICISDEAHRTQTGVTSKVKKTEEGVVTTHGFAKYLRDSFPNATYCGFTGTPIDETIAVFGDIVDSYTMKQSSDDGITERIAYEPRLARVIMSDEKAKEIQKYYDRVLGEGANPAQVEESQKSMSKMNQILGNKDRLQLIASDIVKHYKKLTYEKPEIVQKAMIVCSSREIAYQLLQEILIIQPDWGSKRKSENEDKLNKNQLDKLISLPKINMVATRGQNDRQELYDICGTKEYRKMLARQFKNNDSNFKIAIVVDMWITGFDVPSLAVMYIDKPLQKHTLIQTISRVNRVFDGKDQGLIVDYIGIKNQMMEAIKSYNDPKENPIDEINITLGIFKNLLSLIDDLFSNFNATEYYEGEPLERLNSLNKAAEYVQASKDLETRFMGLTRRLKSSYSICAPSGELRDLEVSRAQFYFAVRSIIYKQTKGESPDAEIMNLKVEAMVQEAILFTGIENIVDEEKSIDLYSEKFINQLDEIDLPISKFNALLRLLRKAINEYGRTNKVKSIEFNERLRRIVDEYNSRDKLVFTSEVVEDFVNNLSDKLLEILKDLETDKTSFEKLGISYEEKAFYDILIKVRDDHGFSYSNENSLKLAKKIKNLVVDKSQYVDWSRRDDIKNQLNMELTVLLYENGYPPEWDEVIFEKVMEQAENFKDFNS